MYLLIVSYSMSEVIPSSWRFTSFKLHLFVYFGGEVKMISPLFINVSIDYAKFGKKGVNII